MKLDLTDDVNARRSRNIKNNTKVFIVGFPLGCRDVKASRLQNDWVIDVADEGVREVGQLLATVPTKKRSKSS